MKKIKFAFALFFISVSASLLFGFNDQPSIDLVRYSTPELLSFDELISLSKNPYPSGPLLIKLKKLWTTPIISNEAYYRGVRPPARRNPELGPFLRVATWNIEKSFEVEGAIAVFTDRQKYQSMVDPSKVSPSSEKYQTALYERDLLAEADVVLLQEMDIGVKRSEYRNAPKELAEALDMNYAYGAAYLEIDPAYLGLETIEFEEGVKDEEAMEYFRVDPARYKGLFGSAVLSRYPIKAVTVFPLRNQGYDWYWGEKQRTTFLEKTRRLGAKTFFLSELHREMKVGNRIFMRVDLHVPGLPNDTLTVINVHLEIKCLPKARQAQIEEILEYIKNITNPVVMAGDFNSAPTDLSPTSVGREVKRQIKNPTNWFSLAATQVLPQALLVNTTRAVSNVTKNFQNPTARHIPVIAPNYVAGLFKAVENYRFHDGYAFDFRGDSERSVDGESGLLSNSNQRDRVGYKTSFQVRRPLGPVIGKYRLDWVFVKSFLRDPKDTSGPYRFAPHFGRTLEDMNTVLVKQISDHHPNVVALPFEEPLIGRKGSEN
ncbi:MAG: endonuclease/exonuclease/phosphatase family protein [Candidatus Omnitrophica bacterium]|nr:endonuclease/exonuclease/phosphatase family protein [Candidatus Omnitrophota bacterium]